MGDMGNIYQERKAFFREKRESNLEYSTHLLKQLNVSFEEKNCGYHLIIKHHDKVIDFYPSTGLWWNRKTRHRQRRGVRALLKYLKIDLINTT